MPLQTGELLQAAEMIAENRQMRATVKGSLLGAGVTALTTFVGGILAGPPGLVIGATSGGFASYKMTQGKFKPLVTILREDLTDAQKLKLANHLSNAVRDFGITDILALTAALTSQEAVIKVFISALKCFVEGELKLPVTY